MVDVLGNNVITIFSSRVEPGEQTVTYPINNKLNIERVLFYTHYCGYRIGNKAGIDIVISELAIDVN